MMHFTTIYTTVIPHYQSKHFGMPTSSAIAAEGDGGTATVFNDNRPAQAALTLIGIQCAACDRVLC